MSENKIHAFEGNEIDVHWDQRLCIHVGECTHADNSLFEGGREPWCIPDEVAKAEVREVCERCPSGALSYVDKDGTAEQPAAENTGQVVYNGPLYLTGELEIEGAPEDMPGVRFRAALCRCGASKNKPFCDNSHIEAGFEDFGAIGKTGPGLEATGGPLKIKAIPDGPLKVEGNLTLRAASGRIAWQGTKTALCRCGASKNKPFCDASHREAGFKSD
ncbi:CDGSH iron-sulfur domain-containing protein [Lamprobacter modestohalophilus]|uniref:CDGSH iron-sulfur domain-containing protein n=1 Tax=Lamprobacter modestohalophilus TaxID=1064514 RepID=UPI002ADEEB4A|nr:CDGSH iron-sulfur domain-containing protein [Lamprobacter modestohalophilus]MEA1048845.1 CDGSH iron-sulfur domain-containing protein [Lamprobacter modestohalophilus]